MSPQALEGTGCLDQSLPHIDTGMWFSCLINSSSEPAISKRQSERSGRCSDIVEQDGKTLWEFRYGLCVLLPCSVLRPCLRSPAFRCGDVGHCVASP